MKIRLHHILYFSIAILSQCSAYRILGVFPFSSKNHNIVFEALMKGLAKAGHQVDVISHYPLKKPIKNYNDIINLNGTMENLTNNYTIQYVQRGLTKNIIPIVVKLYGDRICHFMGLEEMQKLIKNPPTKPPYDVVIVEAFVANCYMGLGYVFKVPVVAVSTATEYPWISDFTGNNDNLAVVPNAFHDGVGKMTYWERLKNVIVHHMVLHSFHTLTEKNQTDAMRKYLSADIPDIREVERNVALTLVNNHPIIFGVKPTIPTLVEIAGLHVQENDETLVPELKKWMDDSKHGVIFFSLGSIVVIESIPEEQLKEIYASFKKIAPVRVLMRVADESKLLPGLPDNVKVSPWVPQIAVLAHPNIKAFITHCGLGGLQEALYHGVPLIGMPLFGDQFRNCKTFAAKEMLIEIDYKQFSGELLDTALEAILHNSTYSEKAKCFSKLFRDNPMSPMKRAIFWIEYVVRNGQALRPSTLDFTWWQLALLDVYGFILFVLILGVAIIAFIIKIILKMLFKVMPRKWSCTNEKKKKK